MCGIAGYIAKNYQPKSLDLIKSMTRAVAHRGPDDEGILHEDNVFLGHRRLAIIDLSPGGHQPMTRSGTGLSIVFSGEIYNYIEVRRYLEGLGQVFCTNTDTEVILAAYDVWGESCVEQFNGMWAFAILDRRRNILFCSRDRFGVKPFYYVETGQAWLFGSEIRQLLPFLPNIRANKKAVQEFLFANIAENERDTFFDGIKKIPPGHNLIYDIKLHSLTLKRYYSLNLQKTLESLPIEESIDQYGQKLSDAVVLRLRSDVPIGACLSGGLDSSSIVTLATERSRGEPFCAITAVSEQSDNNESIYAQKVVESAGLIWLKVRPTYEDFIDSLNEVVVAQEEPFASPSVCMQFFVMRCAKENDIPVLLDGQGGDETLLGYERYYTTHFINLYKRLGMKYAVKSLFDCYKNNSKMTPITILQYLLYFSSARVRYWNYCFRNHYLQEFPPMPEKVKLSAQASWNIHSLQKLEIECMNLPPLLRYEDKNSTWHSIETRLPFLDYQTLEVALSLPGEAKINKGWTKYVLRKHMSGKMPDEITWRKNKIGFEAPTHLWLDRYAGNMFTSVCTSKLLKTLCKPGVLERCYHSLDYGTKWRLFSVAMWEAAFSVESC